MIQDGMIVQNSPRDRLVPGPLGARHYVRHKCYNGYTLFSCAHSDIAYLIDMNGMVMHTWPVVHSQLQRILPNGNLLSDGPFVGMRERTLDGEEVWLWEGKCHHDFHLVGEHEIVFLMQRDYPVKPGFYEPGAEPDAMASDVIVRMDRRNNEVQWEFSFWEHLDELVEMSGLPQPLPYGTVDPGSFEVYPTKPGKRDWAHCNTSEVLPDTPLGRRDERFRAGNILFSLRSLDTIGVVDPEKNAIVWAWGWGVLDGQHQPTLTPDGTILMFDNGSGRNYSSLVEIDPTTCEEVWRYEDRSNFYSHARSGVQRLPNGNTLVAESDAGRIFEITKEKEIVWDYHNPFPSRCERGQGRHIYRATRYREDEVECVLSYYKNFRASSVANEERAKFPSVYDALKFYHHGLGG